LFGPAESSDATQLLLEFQEEFEGDAARGMLIEFVRRRHTGRPRGFRYWNHLGASIWKAYLGLRDCKERTGKAHGAEVKRYRNAARRAGKEVNRAALRRIPKSLPLRSSKSELIGCDAEQLKSKIKRRA
jgi:hypothetical protein